jgi:hypothetical protein
MSRPLPRPRCIGDTRDALRNFGSLDLHVAACIAAKLKPGSAI